MSSIHGTLITSLFFHRADTECSESEWPTVRQLIRRGAEADHRLVWVNGPSNYGREVGVYWCKADKSDVDVLYVAAALIIEVPAFGTTRRNGSFP